MVASTGLLQRCGLRMSIHTNYQPVIELAENTFRPSLLSRPHRGMCPPGERDLWPLQPKYMLPWTQTLGHKSFSNPKNDSKHTSDHFKNIILFQWTAKSIIKFKQLRSIRQGFETSFPLDLIKSHVMSRSVHEISWAQSAVRHSPPCTCTSASGSFITWTWAQLCAVIY